MTTIAIKDVGFCADFSHQGDWAFDYALSLARRRQWGLKVFYVPYLAWDARDVPTLPPDEIDALDRQVREYYDQRLGDFVEVGFRVCEGFADRELRRCFLMRHEYQVLVLAYRAHGAPFAGRTIEQFAYAFNSPVVMVGPDRPDQFLVNPAASVLARQLDLEAQDCSVITDRPPVPVGR